MIYLSDLWEHTITIIFKHDPKYKVDIMTGEWDIYNKMEDFDSLLYYTDEDFTPSGNLCCYKDYGNSVVKMLPTTPLQKLENLRWYAQHLIDESGYEYDDEFNNLLGEDKWILPIYGKFMKYVLFTLHKMIPEQLKMNPIKPIIKVSTNQELNIDEGESNKDEEESIMSTELSEENSTFDIPTDTTEDSKLIETSQDHNVLNKSTHDEDDSSEEESVTEFEQHLESGEQNIGKENKLLSTNL